MSSFKLSESLKSVAQGLLEIFEDVYPKGGGAQCALPLGWDAVLRHHFWARNWTSDENHFLVSS